jgi:hypothetical protein
VLSSFVVLLMCVLIGVELDPEELRWESRGVGGRLPSAKGVFKCKTVIGFGRG